MPAERRDTAALSQAVLQLERNLKIAEAKLQSTAFLAGDQLTLADIQFGNVLYRYFNVHIERDSELKNIARYYHELGQRPAYREHVMVSYEELVDSM